MDKSLITILMLTPGIIGIAFSALLCGNSKPESLSKNITRYFLYSAVSWLLAEFIGPGYVLSAVLQGQPITVMQLFVPIIISVAITAIWVIVAKEQIVLCLNWFYRKIKRNEIFMEPALFEKIFADNKSHFIEVLKDNQTQAKGYLEHYQCNEKSFSLKDITAYSKCKEETVRYLVYPDREMIIREFTYLEIMGKKDDN